MLLKNGYFGTDKFKFCFAVKKDENALPGNRTQVSRMGILNDTITPAVPAPLTEKDEKRDIVGRKKKTYFKRKRELRCEQGSNLCGNIPLDFESNALTTRPSQHLNK